MKQYLVRLNKALLLGALSVGPLVSCSGVEDSAAIEPVADDGFFRVASNATYGCRRPHGYGLYDSEEQKTFLCWNGPGMTILGRAYDHREQAWEATQTIQTLDFDDKWDYHNYPNMTQAPDGRLLVAWADHCEALYLARAEAPHELTSNWETLQIATNRNAYPMIFSLRGQVYVFYSVDEERAWPYRSFGYVTSSDNGLTWSEHVRAIDSEKQDPDHIDEIYAFHYEVEMGEAVETDRVHFSWVMRGGPNGHNRGARNGYFAYFYPHTGIWTGADGASLGDWIDYSEMLDHCLVVETGPVLKGYPIDKIMSSYLPDHRPIVVYNLDGKAHQAVWDGAHWEARQISDDNAKSIRRTEAGALRLLLAAGGQPTMQISELLPGQSDWKSVYSSEIPYDSGATNTWSMSFIDQGLPEVEVLMSQIERGQEKLDYTGSWPVWSVDTTALPESESDLAE